MKINGFTSINTTNTKLFLAEGDRHFIFGFIFYIIIFFWWIEKCGISFDFICIITIVSRNIHSISFQKEPDEQRIALGHVSSRYQKMMYRLNGIRLKVFGLLNKRKNFVYSKHDLHLITR